MSSPTVAAAATLAAISPAVDAPVASITPPGKPAEPHRSYILAMLVCSG